MSVALTINVGSFITVKARDPKIVAVGVSGPAGPANSLSIGTVTTGAAGSSASATITGTAPSQSLSLAIPRGDTGSAATVSVGSTTTGAAGSSASVTNSGSSSAAVLNFIVPQGTKGDTGTAATVSVGSTTTGAAGTSASVTNSGSSSAAVLNFTVPTGATGAAGDWSTAQNINPVSGTTYPLTGSDVGRLVTFSSAGTGSPATVTVTVPTGIASVGQRIDLAQLGTGQVSITGGSGVTVLATPTLKLRTQYSAATLICTATTATPTATYLLVGDLAAS